MTPTILAHRGWWTTPAEKNTIAAFARAFDAGIGVELDVRDFDGGLVVSHDPPIYESKTDPKIVWFWEVIDLLAGRDLPLAVNVKSCGLAPLFAKIEKKPPSWFFFDVAPGDEFEYVKKQLPIMVREHWETANPVLTISPEIFGTDPIGHWTASRNWEGKKAIYLITDRVTEAMDFFQ